MGSQRSQERPDEEMITRAGLIKLDWLRINQMAAEQSREPWGGRSPRALTKGFSLRTLRHEDVEMNAISSTHRKVPEDPYGT